MPTTVRKLTPHNVATLEARAGHLLTELSKTVATFAAEPAEAAKLLQEVMDEIRAESGGHSTDYRSLIAVRNKLRAQAVAS
ncbi:hypothetical protein ACWDUL_21275 [Nocardia niigatensis]